VDVHPTLKKNKKNKLKFQFWNYVKMDIRMVNSFLVFKMYVDLYIYIIIYIYIIFLFSLLFFYILYTFSDIFDYNNLG